MITTQWVTQQFADLSDVAPMKPGGQKWVFRARHPADGDVVLKIIKPRMNIDRVEREILAVQAVKSPRVPNLLEVGTVSTPNGNFVWFRENRIMGECVEDLVGHGPLNKADVLNLALHVLETLTSAERDNIVHRDVKPANLIRADDGPF